MKYGSENFDSHSNCYGVYSIFSAYLLSRVRFYIFHSIPIDSPLFASDLYLSYPMLTTSCTFLFYFICFVFFRLQLFTPFCPLFASFLSLFKSRLFRAFFLLNSTRKCPLPLRIYPARCLNFIRFLPIKSCLGVDGEAPSIRPLHALLIRDGFRVNSA